MDMSDSDRVQPQVRDAHSSPLFTELAVSRLKARYGRLPVAAQPRLLTVATTPAEVQIRMNDDPPRFDPALSAVGWLEVGSGRDARLTLWQLRAAAIKLPARLSPSI